MSRPIVLIHSTLQSNKVEPRIKSVARALIWQLVSALEFMHLQPILHRDVKLANLLLTTGKVFWRPQSRDRPHHFVLIPFFPDKSQIALPPLSTAFIAPMYLHL